MVFRSSMHIAIMLEKMWILNGFAKGKGFGWILSILPHVPLNKIFEQKFAILFNRVCSMLHDEAEPAIIVTLLENNLIIPNRDLSQFQQFLGRERELFCL